MEVLFVVISCSPRSNAVLLPMPRCDLLLYVFNMYLVSSRLDDEEFSGSFFKQTNKNTTVVELL